MCLFYRLWQNHPTGEFPCATGNKRNFDNQCSIRMGVCLEKSGINTTGWAVRRCWQHKNERGHILAAEELASVLYQKIIPGIKKAEKFSGKEGFEKINGRKGIVFFKNFYGLNLQGDHIDLWNGWRLSSLVSAISIYTPWGSHYDKGEIWFWEVI